MRRSIKHMAAVLRDRPVQLIVTAMKSRLGELASSVGFAGEAKRIAKSVIDVISRRWTARLSIHLWDRLELSRRRMDDLMHLLSFVYRPLSDTYERIVVWQHPSNKNDVLYSPAIVGRAGREADFAELADAAGIQVGEDGRCQRDAVKCANEMYSRFSRAMRHDFSTRRPARPILFFDGTGGSLGKGICHAEIGSADFTGSCKQSRASLSPLALYSGNDHALPLRSNMTEAVDSFNVLSSRGTIQREDGDCIPCEPIVVGDMQGVKAITGQAECCHSVWCKCQARGEVDDGEGPQHQYGDADFASYEDMTAFYNEIGCEFKTEDFMLACAHISKGCFHGKKFTPFECPCCGYKPSAITYHADWRRFQAMTDEEQKVKRKEHVQRGAHWHVVLYMGPMMKGCAKHSGADGMRRVGVDDLHLAYLNMFKHLFKYTIHEPLPVSKQKIVSRYLRDAGFYSYDAADESDDPVKRWIGREIKRFLHEADHHLPFLLGLASSQIDACPETQAATNAADEEVMDVSDDEFAPSEEEIAVEAARTPLISENATFWDDFLQWTRDTETEWAEDTDEYRKARALKYCNGARRVARALLQLKPTMHSWVPHIACNIVPRQIVELGDTRRRSADACESYGACAKKIIKLLTCRREISARFRRGYVEQAFRRLCVRSEIIHGEANEPFLQRSDARLLGSGRKDSAPASVQGPHILIRVKVEQDAEKA